MKKRIIKNVTLSKETFIFLLERTNHIIEYSKGKIQDFNDERKREEEAIEKGIEYKIYDFYYDNAKQAEEDLKNFVPLREMLLGVYDFESEV